MKIERLILKNYANIWTVYKSKEIEIDLRQSKNKIILLKGPNGSGKTTILSSLHPFATNGNMDARNDTPLIRKGHDGYKEIQINDCGNEYIIKHFYTANKDKNHSVKSYITRNGLELNPNGNVSSFKEIVKNELDIEQDYLKLIRLGNNVTNFIDLKTTDRKAFMGKILEELDVYLNYFKKVTADMRSLKVLISHLIDKISKLDISNIDETKDSQKRLKKEIDKLRENLAEETTKLNIVNYEIEKYDSPLVVKEKLYEKQKDVEKISKLISKKNSEGITIDNCQEMIVKLNNTLISYNLELNSLRDKRTMLLESLDKLIQESNTIDKELSKIQESSDIKETENMINELRTTIERRSSENQLLSYEYKFTKKELEELIIMLDKNNDILYTTYEFGKDPINKALKFILHNENISDYVSGHKDKVTKNKLQTMCSYVYQELTKNKGIPIPNCNNNSACKVMDFFDTLYEYATEEPDAIIEDDTFVTYTKMAYQNISSIFSDIRNYESTFIKLPKEAQELFTFKNISERIGSLQKLYNKDILYRELTKVTEYEIQQEDLKKLQNLKDKLNLIKKSIGNSEYFEHKKETIISDIEFTRNDIYGITENIDELSRNIENDTKSIAELKELLESLSRKDSVQTEYNELIDIYNKLHELYNDKKDISCVVNEYTYKLEKLEKEYQKVEFNLNTYESLTSQLNEYNTTYDEMEFVKKSLSSKEGIPLLYIEIYLKNIQDITNNLLDMVYDGDLYLSNFEISADEFRIPFVRKDCEIGDVLYASSGERSFISVALSFALIYQSISNYNIMLLDEIDATLDTKNRELFLKILQKQMDMIDAEQTFTISHNNMFSMYPVDIIDMQNKVDDNNTLANYIPIILR